MRGPGAVPVPLPISVRSLERLLLWSIVGLVLTHETLMGLRFWGGHTSALGLVRLFDLDLEDNLPTCFAALQILVAAALAALLARAQGHERGRDARPWRAVAAVLALLAIDEASMLHEQLAHLGRTLVGSEHARGLLSFTWVVPAGLLVIAVALLLLQFVLRQPTQLRNRFFVAAGLYVGGAIGMEMLGAAWVDRHAWDNPVYRMCLMPAEETLEMLGIWVLIGGFLAELRARAPRFELQVGG